MATKIDCLEQGHNWESTGVHYDYSEDARLYFCTRCGYYRDKNSLKLFGDL